MESTPKSSILFSGVAFHTQKRVFQSPLYENQIAAVGELDGRFKNFRTTLWKNPDVTFHSLTFQCFRLCPKLNQFPSKVASLNRETDKPWIFGGSHLSTPFPPPAPFRNRSSLPHPQPSWPTSSQRNKLHARGRSLAW